MSDTLNCHHHDVISDYVLESLLIPARLLKAIVKSETDRALIKSIRSSFPVGSTGWDHLNRKYKTVTMRRRRAIDRAIEYFKILDQLQSPQCQERPKLVKKISRLSGFREETP